MIHSRQVAKAQGAQDFLGPGGPVGGNIQVHFQAAVGDPCFRIHDVQEARDFLAVRAVLAGEAELPADARLPPRLRWEQGETAS